MGIDKPQSEIADVDLIVATVNRDCELADFFVSVRDSSPVSTRVILVDQNTDDRVDSLLRGLPEVPRVLHLKAERGVSHARTVGLACATAPIVAWPDDDCSYPPGLLSRVVAEFAAVPAVDVLVGRLEDPSGDRGVLAVPAKRLVLDSKSLWRYSSAPTYFARRSAAERVGDWTTRFGPGGTTPWDAGEDTDWLIRAVQAGLVVRFDPTLAVLHRSPFLRGSKEARDRARRYGRCTSAVALAHGYGLRFVARLVIRAAVGSVVSLAAGRFARAAIHFHAMIGRIEGALGFTRFARGGVRDIESGPHGDTSRSAQ